MGANKKKNRLNGDAGKGIAIRESLHEGSGTILYQKRYLQFSKSLIPEFKNKFEELKKNSKIEESCQFESNHWFGLGNYHNKHFYFTSFEFNSELSQALKCFVVTELYDRELTLEVLSNRFSALKKALVDFNFFRSESIDSFEEYILQSQELGVSISELVFGVESFLFFYPINNSKDYLEILESVSVYCDKNRFAREIPNIESIVWFDYLIGDFMSTFSNEKVAKYYPIYLWWRITSVIPLRPIEFIYLEYGCCFRDKTDGKYYLKVPRKKRRKVFHKKKVLEIIDTLETNSEIYELINEYKRMLKIDDSEAFLLSLRAYSNVFSYDQHIIKDRISKQNLDNLLAMFYDEIIHGHYGFNILHDNSEINDENSHNSIVKLKLGDTRHLAFCSMMLQGFNPLVIAQMGGHQLLESQSHYGQHLDDFIGSYTRMLSKFLKANEEKTGNAVHEKYLTKEKIEMMYRFRDRKVQREIENGKCYSENFPNECIYEDCIDCREHFSIDFDILNRVVIDRINEKLEKSKRDVHIKVEFIQRYYIDIIKDGSIDLSNLKCNAAVENDLKRHSKQLYSMARNQANLIAKMEKISELYQNNVSEEGENIVKK